MAQGEPRTLARRTEDVEDRVEPLQVQTGGDLVAVLEGRAVLRREVRDGFAAANGRLHALDTRVGDLAGEVRGLAETDDRDHARIIELLTQLVGKDPTVD